MQLTGHIANFALMSLLISFLLSLFVVHDYFVSICTITHNAPEQRLQIVWRMTTHDVEHALSAETDGKTLHFGSELELPQADSLLQAYLIEHLAIEIDGDPVQVEYLGRDVEMEDLYCYLQVQNAPHFQTIKVHSTLLFDMFHEQENVVHLETESGTLSHSFRQNSLPHTFMVPK